MQPAPILAGNLKPAVCDGKMDLGRQPTEPGSEAGDVSSNHGDAAQPAMPPVEADGLRHWYVAGGVVADHRGLLLVENLRRNGDVDWSTPGGVVDPGETPVEGLTREVREETGLEVDSWLGPIYRVEVTAPDAGFLLRVEAHRAKLFSGELAVEDPDGIVVSAEFVDIATARAKLDRSPLWVAEPLLAHVEDEIFDGRVFRYHVEGRTGASRRITRSHDA